MLNNPIILLETVHIARGLCFVYKRYPPCPYLCRTNWRALCPLLVHLWSKRWCNSVQHQTGPITLSDNLVKEQICYGKYLQPNRLWCFNFYHVLFPSHLFFISLSYLPIIPHIFQFVFIFCNVQSHKLDHLFDPKFFWILCILMENVGTEHTFTIPIHLILISIQSTVTISVVLSYLEWKRFWF